MAIVTYLPRVLPAFLVGKKSFSPFAERFLSLIPYTAMAALIFPNVLFTDETRLSIGLVGGGVALVLSWFRVPVVGVIIGAVLADICLYLWI